MLCWFFSVFMQSFGNHFRRNLYFIENRSENSFNALLVINFAVNVMQFKLAGICLNSKTGTKFMVSFEKRPRVIALNIKYGLLSTHCNEVLMARTSSIVKYKVLIISSFWQL